MNENLKARLDRIKLYMGESGVPETNKRLADELGVTEQSLWRYCSGHSLPRARTLKRISRLETKLGIET